MKYIKPKIIPTIVLLIILCIVFFFIYIKFYNQERLAVNSPKVQIYETTCGMYENGTVAVDSKKISVDISDDICKRDLGLSGRNSMIGDNGMIFIFDREGNYGFWMKDMNFSLDIVWIDSNFKITGIEKDLTAKTYPNSFGRNFFARYVLEIPAGYTTANKIKVGDKIIFTKNNN